MKAVVQRVASASVEVEGRTVSAIGPGLLVLVGIHDLDTDSDAEYIQPHCPPFWVGQTLPFVSPIDINSSPKSNARTPNAVQALPFLSAFYVDQMTVSQFTLYGILKGNKPDFHVAMAPDRAKSFYASLVERFQRSYKSDRIKDGVFGAMMKVNLVNDGPVTMQLESPNSSRNNNDASEAERTVNGE